MFSNTAQYDIGPYYFRAKILSYAVPQDRTKQGTTVVPLKSGWDHPVKFYRQKCDIFRAILLSKMKKLLRDTTHFLLISLLSLDLY